MWTLRSPLRPPASTGSLPEAGAFEPTETRVHVDDPAGREILGKAIAAHLASFAPSPEPVTLVCVGSDRSTGDRSARWWGRAFPGWRRRGSPCTAPWSAPSTRPTCAERLPDLRRQGKDRLVVAVDACLGRAENVGTVCVSRAP